MIHHTAAFINTELDWGGDIYDIAADTWQNNRKKKEYLQSLDTNIS